MTQSVNIPLSQIAIRFAQLQFLYPQHAEDRLTLAAIYGYKWDDELLEISCDVRSQYIYPAFRFVVMDLLEDIAFRGITPANYEDIIYSLIRETGCTPEQAQEVLNHD